MSRAVRIGSWRQIGLMLLIASMGMAASAASQTTDELFDDSRLHDVKLSVHSADWQALKNAYTENTYYPADMEWRGIKVRNVGIRSRGMASRNDVKPGLRVDFNRYVADQRFLGLRALVLDNAYRDVSTIKERVAMKLFARMGVPAPREAHARVYVNNTLVGVYVITEELNEDFVRRVFKKPDAEEADRGTLFEYSWQFDYRFEYLGAALERYQPLFEPRTHENDTVSELYGPLEELVRLMNSTAGDDFASAVGARLDLVQAMTYVAVDRFLADYDGFLGYKGMANFYLYRFAHDGRSVLVPWDKDQSFYVANLQIGHALGDNVLVSRAIGVPALRDAYLQALDECARMASEAVENAGANWLEAEVIRADAQVRDAVRADPGRWFSFDDYADEIERMREFARTRPAFIACEVADARDNGSRACAAPSETGPR